jgi:hypothetical protein
MGAANKTRQEAILTPNAKVTGNMFAAECPLSSSVFFPVDLVKLVELSARIHNKLKGM